MIALEASCFKTFIDFGVGKISYPQVLVFDIGEVSIYWEIPTDLDLTVGSKLVIPPLKGSVRAFRRGVFLSDYTDLYEARGKMDLLRCRFPFKSELTIYEESHSV